MWKEKENTALDSILSIRFLPNLLMSLMGLFIYLIFPVFGVDFSIGKVPWEVAIILFLYTIFQIFYFITFTLERIIISKKLNRGLFWIIKEYTIVIFWILLSFTSNYWILYNIDSSSFIGHMGEGFFEEFFNCFYFSVVTFTTVGYGDIQPLGYIRLFSLLEIFTGFIMIVYIISNLSSVSQSLVKKIALVYMMKLMKQQKILKKNKNTNPFWRLF